MQLGGNKGESTYPLNTNPRGGWSSGRQADGPFSAAWAEEKSAGAVAGLNQPAGQQQHDGNEEAAEDEQVEVDPAHREVLLEHDVDHRAQDRPVQSSHASDEGHAQGVPRDRKST